MFQKAGDLIYGKKAIEALIQGKNVHMLLQEYCSHARPKTEYIATLSEIHAPPKFRYVLAVINCYDHDRAKNS